MVFDTRIFELERGKSTIRGKKYQALLFIMAGFASLLTLGLLVADWCVLGAILPNQRDYSNGSRTSPQSSLSLSCDNIYSGYQCQTNVSHSWGQYSPFFTQVSQIPDVLPSTCNISFAQVLSRHGARYPTAAKSASYAATILKIKSSVISYNGNYAFLQNFLYDLSSDNLTTFGQQEMVNSGIKFFQRYVSLTAAHEPFIRSADENRVIVSAQNFSQGYHMAKKANVHIIGRDTYPYPIVPISEATGSNNTLNHQLCTNFETGVYSTVASAAQAKFAAVFVPPIQARLNANLPNANLTSADTINMMDMCPYEVVSSINGVISKFCALFTTAEWQQYDYYQSLNKYYGYGPGNPLGPTQGVGFTNELIARMTNKPVVDATSTNHTLDSNPMTFPLGTAFPLYADFSHDNDMTAIFSAIGLFNSTVPLSNTTVETLNQANGYSAATTVSFAARAYFEKMTCSGESEELVRILINDRVMPLTQCGGDMLGRCTLSSFINSLSFAQGNGLWSQCFQS